jgi:transposase
MTSTANPNLALLEIVAEAREVRDQATVELRRAIVRAHAGGYSLRQIAPHAQMTYGGVAHLIQVARERGET